MIITAGTKVKDEKGNTYTIGDDAVQGGFGYVFPAYRESDGKKFAVKTILNTFTDSSSFLSFKNEVLQAEKVCGDNIIHYEYIHNGEVFTECPPYIIMEYADGGTLKDIIERRKERNNPYSKEELVFIYKELINGMKKINEILVHRDIKPANILISNNAFKISDFGLAKVVDEITRSKTFKGYGTIPYMAPEVWNNQKNTIQMDIYSMGIVFYELATLEYPYDIKVKTEEEYRKAHLFAPVKNITLLKQRVGTIISSIILRMLEKPMQNRFANWDEILEKMSCDKEGESLFDSVVLAAISTTLQRETTKKQEIAARKKQEEEKENFTAIVMHQIVSTVFSVIRNFAEDYNNKSSSIDKCRFIIDKKENNSYNAHLYIPEIDDIYVNAKVVYANSETRTVRGRVVIGQSFGDPFDVYNAYPQTTETFTPYLRKQEVIGWVEIKNKREYGFNLILVKSTGLYGDWYILENKNNFSHLSGNANAIKKEPFAFKINELANALNNVDVTGLYSVKPIKFSSDEFMKIFCKLL